MLIRFRLLPALFLVVVGGSPILSQDRKAAESAYAEAFRFGLELLAKPESKRTIPDYRKAVSLYRRVVDLDPDPEIAADSIYAVATLYDRMADRAPQGEYRREAVRAYRRLAREYPRSRHRGPALDRAEQLETPVLRKAPVSGKTPLAVVSEIRYRASENYTRVVIQLDREVQFEKQVLQSPDRIYFDLAGTRPGPDLNGRTISVDGVFIKRIRVARNRPEVVRVVLDYNKIRKQTVFALFEPFRIVIDTHGHGSGRKAKTTREFSTARPARPAPSAVATRRKPPETRRAAKRGPQEDLTLTRVLGLKVGRVVVDPGHGGHDAGAIGPGGLREKDLVLSIAKRLKPLLEQRLGTQVIMTRDDDRFIPLEERTAIANQHQADLFISIHGNSSHGRRATGAETFYLNFARSASAQEVATRENAASQRTVGELEDLVRQITKGTHNAESRKLAGVVQANLFSGIKKHRRPFLNRGVKTAPFIVLMGASMPSILTEVGFISNPDEERFLTTAENHQRVAEALFEGVKQYLQDLANAGSQGDLAGIQVRDRKGKKK
ncbi:MAG: N-acetylmuramoyl-L-alanine amidase [Acidobacteriota bacterium]|nr:N-acetylmuramoyl-L-alanine amidase [Acidobacteriota bacterium]